MGETTRTASGCSMTRRVTIRGAEDLGGLMRAFAAGFLPIALIGSAAAAGRQQDADTEQVDLKIYPDSANCRFKHLPNLQVLETPPLLPGGKNPGRMGYWSDPKPTIESGPPASLTIMFMKPSTPRGDPWMIIASVDVPPNKALTQETVARWKLAIDGLPASLLSLRPQFPPTLMAPAADPADKPDITPVPPPPRDASFQTAMDDTALQRLFSSKTVTAEFFDGEGRLLGRYRWDISPMRGARALLDRVAWGCVRPK